MKARVGVVAIGRNEGQRLIDCLDALAGRVDRVVYVDSGSTDNSVAEAEARGIDVVDLDMTIPFTAARARNAGLMRLSQLALEHEGSDIDYVQFIDGDCVLKLGWIRTACQFLEENPKAAAACGRNRERFPEASIYNQLADDEWDTPVGPAKATGGNVMMRKRALDEVGSFNPDMIAGEEPELCIRLRAAGWTIWRLDHDMTLHDANLLYFGQWWQRAKRSGYVYAEGVVMHGARPERHGVRELKHIVAWGMLLPAAIIIGVALVSPWALLLALLWSVQVLRRMRRGEPWRQAALMTFVKFPESLGALRYWRTRLTRGPAKLIEHK